MEIVIVLRDARRAALIASLLPELKRLSFLVRGHQSHVRLTGLTSDSPGIGDFAYTRRGGQSVNWLDKLRGSEQTL
jgi:hypothetical protein